MVAKTISQFTETFASVYHCQLLCLILVPINGINRGGVRVKFHFVI